MLGWFSVLAVLANSLATKEIQGHSLPAVLQSGLPYSPEHVLEKLFSLIASYLLTHKSLGQGAQARQEIL